MQKLLAGILVLLCLAGCGVDLPPVPETTLPAVETSTESPLLCIRCKAQPSGGYGPSGMECADCYNGNNAILAGTYDADFENVRITLEPHDYVDYILTYTDLTAGITLERIPLTYYNADTDTDVSMMFLIDESYPQYSGYVEVCWSEGDVFPYSYNALIEGLEDTGGDYSGLTKAP